MAEYEESLISIIIPTLHRLELLEPTLVALGGVRSSQRHEVIVVNDSPLPLSDLRRDLLSRSVPFRVLELGRNYGLPAARNLGAAAARGDVFAFIDDDIAPRADWLDRITASFAARADVGAVMGRICSARSGALERLREITYEHRHRMNLPGSTAVDSEALAEVDYLSGGNCAVRRSVFCEVGGCNPELKKGQDRDLAFRIRLAGWKLAYNPEMVVTHDNSGTTLPSMLGGRFSSGRCAALLRMKYAIARDGPRSNSVVARYGKSLGQLATDEGLWLGLLAVGSSIAYSLGRASGKLWRR